ncbi:integral membrane protein PTH11 [Fusarium beomiforme]|uniref:Integral membrane protein PTH11 n=1 Tax=Fusarium beomiforme TaxID=44412 RepID=A0A9P5AEU7_9HYPO|nr:integral membrane protein PTH11 [Fusarium beomiforme]
MDPRAFIAENSVEMTEANLKAFDIEAFTLLGLALLVTVLRSCVRISTVGCRNLWADDYLVILAAGIYAIETGLAYSVGSIAHGLANNSITNKQRASLQPQDQEYQLRVTGSKIQLALWATYSSLLWILKAAMCTFYYRLTKDLQGHRIRVIIGFGFIVASFVIVQMNLLLSCRPFNNWWQIFPDPGAFCHAAISPALIWACLAFNLATDFYLIMIPMPMLWKAAMPWPQKVGLIALFSCGLFVTMAAILRVVLLVSDSINGPQLAASWALRETFVAIMTTNIPMLFPTFKKWAVPIVERAGSSLSIYRSPQSTAVDPRFSGTSPLDNWRRKSRGSSRIASVDPASPTISESEAHLYSVGLTYTILDSSIKRPEASKTTHKIAAIRLPRIDASPSPAPDLGYGRLSTRSNSSVVSWSETLVNSPQSGGSELLLGLTKPAERRLPTTPPEKSVPLSSPELPPAPSKRKRKSACHDSPIPLKIKKTTSAHKGTGRPRTLKWLEDLKREDLEPIQSQPFAGSGTSEDEDICKVEEIGYNLGPKTFQQDSFTTSWEEIGLQQNLEFFQAFPHDEFSTLCINHFMELAESWYSRRKPMVNYQVQKMVRDRLNRKPDFSKFALPVCQESWTVKNPQDFSLDLHEAINKASDEVKLNYKQILRATGKRPICELGNQSWPLKCALCTNHELPRKGKYADIDQAHCHMDVPPYDLDSFDAELQKALSPIPHCCHRKALTILGGSKSQDYLECEQCSYVQELPLPPLQTPKEFAVKVAGTLIPVKIRPERQYLNSKLGHVDVSGIHIIVDHCAGESMIKFRSTRFSKCHEMYGYDFHLEDEIKMVGNDLPGEPTEYCHEYDNEEDLSESETTFAQFDKLY